MAIKWLPLLVLGLLFLFGGGIGWIGFGDQVSIPMYVYMVSLSLVPFICTIVIPNTYHMYMSSGFPN